MRSEDYEKVAVFKNNEIELITSPNGSRIIAADRVEVRLYSDKVEYYLIRRKT